MILFNLTNSEYYRLYSNLTPERIEKLLEIEEDSKTDAEFESLYNKLLCDLQVILDYSDIDIVKEEIEEILNRS